MLDVGRPDDYRNRQSEGPPEFVAEHGDGMSRVAVMPRMPAGHCVPGVRMNRLRLRSVMHLAQGKTPGTRNEMLRGNESTNPANIEAYFLSRVTPCLTSRLCRAPVRMDVSNRRLAVVISSPTIE